MISVTKSDKVNFVRSVIHKFHNLLAKGLCRLCIPYTCSKERVICRECSHHNVFVFFK